MAGRLANPTAGLCVVLPQDFRAPLGATGMELVIPARTVLNLAAAARGTVARPVVESLVLTASSPGIAIRPASGTFKELKELDLDSVTIRRGGVFDFRYDLSVERMGQGAMALVALLGMASGRNVGPVPDVKLASVRKEIDALLAKEVPPRFKAFLKQYDALVPGMSLMSLFGV